MKCSQCGKDIVLAEDWGDYDDASEWACVCREYEMGYCTLCRNNTIHILRKDGFKHCLECHREVKHDGI